MADEGSTPEERTEMPTGRRMGQLRKDGHVHLSNEVVQVTTLLTGFFVLTLLVKNMFQHLEAVYINSFKSIATVHSLNYNEVEKHVLSILKLVTPDLLILTCAIATVAFFSVMLQTDWCVKDKKIKFDFPKMNPIAGLKGMVSIHNIVSSGKALIKLSLILPIAYYSLKQFAPDMIGLIHLSLGEVLAFTGMSLKVIFWKISYLLIALATFDYFWTKHLWLRQNKMTKQEVKEERKSIEGDEETKRKIQATGLQRIMQRIKDSVPQADVVITNPTHFAVALKYDRDKMGAPVVVAKGKDHLAQRIKKIARENNVPVLERKVLARALFHSTEVGAEIPFDLFKAVAEVLAYVYKLKNPYAHLKQRAPAQ